MAILGKTTSIITAGREGAKVSSISGSRRMNQYNYHSSITREKMP